MIVEYHRPPTLDLALQLLSRQSPVTVPMGGGTKLNQPSPKPIAVVDLQDLASQPDLGLGQVEQSSSVVKVGAAVTLQSLMGFGSSLPTLSEVLRLEASYNLRQVATVAGSLISANGRSPFAAAMLALDAQLDAINLEQGSFALALGEYLALRSKLPPHSLVRAIEFPTKARLAFQYVARTPADFPIVAVAAAQWPSGRTRLVLAGYGAAPLLAADGPEAAGIEAAARAGYQYAEDEWASAEYRSATVEILAVRCMNQLLGG
jgi:CO/xanthine dehydrogenase FAD-binding subunit